MASAVMAASGGEPSLKKARQDEGVPAPCTPEDNAGKAVTLDIDDILDKLWAVAGRPPDRQFVHIPEATVEALCLKVCDIFSNQPMLLELEAPLSVCGDIHGQYHDLLRIFKHGGLPPLQDYLFLGDYVDRGMKSIETILMLFAYKVKYSENFFLLRGNHESPSICRIYGFYDECKKRYSVKLWKTFCSVFDWFPACAVIADKVICMHGGLSPNMFFDGVDTRIAVNELVRPADIPNEGLLCDLLWSDPWHEGHGFGTNDRGVSHAFGADIVHNFLQREDMDLIVRAHQVVEDGYEFFADGKLVTLFSAPNYCGEFDNFAAIMNIDENLTCSFVVLNVQRQL